jgi:hypothetical protein
MAYELPGFSFTLPSSADYSATPYIFMDVNASGLGVAATAAGRTVGVLANKPKAGEAATIIQNGIVQVIASAAIVAGAGVQVAAGGQAVVFSTGTLVGVALEAASGANSVIAVLLKG